LTKSEKMPLPAQAKCAVFFKRKSASVVLPVGLVRWSTCDSRRRSRSHSLIKKVNPRDSFTASAMIEISLPRLADRKEDMLFSERFMLESTPRTIRKKIHGHYPRAPDSLAAIPGRETWGTGKRLSLAVMMAETIIASLTCPSLAALQIWLLSAQGRNVTFEELRSAYAAASWKGGRGQKLARQRFWVSARHLYNLLSRAKA